jgi:hypothetical protein
VPERTPVCQLGDPSTGDSRLISPRSGDTQCLTHTPNTPTPNHANEHPIDYSTDQGRGVQLQVTAASQWLHATTGRIATCPHSWMQAVHWVAGSGLYTPTRGHGPKFGTTTITIAQEISALTECRPSVDYLARKLKISERTVQYHLGMLREASLLVYRSKGTRIRGEGARASVFERIIPAAFDEALGIRTVGQGATRRPIGAAPEHRTLLGKLARKAARKVRRRRRRGPSATASSRRGLCTPMQGGTTGDSSAAGTHSPSESKLASGQGKSPTGKSPKRGPRKLNKVGTRYRIAAELIAAVPWLHRANRDRIAWVIGPFTDRGWTAREIQAVAELTPMPDRGVHRPSGLLASRLASKHLVFDTPSKRQHLVAMWEDSRRAERERHQEHETQPQGPARQSVRRLLADAVRHVQSIAFGPAPAVAPAPEECDTRPLRIEDLDKATVLDMRAMATRNPAFILDSLSLGMSERDARRLFTNWLVDQALKAQRTLTPAF